MAIIIGFGGSVEYLSKIPMSIVEAVEDLSKNTTIIVEAVEY